MTFRSPSPEALLDKQIHTVRSSLHGLRDGDADSIHDARVATRRIRELLRSSDRPIADDLRERFRYMGRALGRVRDADVRVELLRTLESKLPDAAPALVPLQHDEGRHRVRLIRKLIKRLESIHVDRLLDGLAGEGRRRLHALLLSAGWSVWRNALGHTIGTRAQTTSDAIEHA